MNNIELWKLIAAVGGVLITCVTTPLIWVIKVEISKLRLEIKFECEKVRSELKSELKEVENRLNNRIDTRLVHR